MPRYVNLSPASKRVLRGHPRYFRKVAWNQKAGHNSGPTLHNKRCKKSMKKGPRIKFTMFKEKHNLQEKFNTKAPDIPKMQYGPFKRKTLQISALEIKPRPMHDGHLGTNMRSIHTSTKVENP